MNRRTIAFFQPLFAIFHLLLVIGCLLTLLIGCDGSPKRYAVQGMVTLDRKPLEKGYLTLAPQEGTASPTAGASITRGQFSIAAAGGVFPGKFRVEITSTRPSTNRVPNLRGGGWFENVDEQFLPSRYNSQSELTAEVKSDAPNEFKFELTSH